MIIHNEKDKYIDELCIFFMYHIAKCDLTSYFEINISNDIYTDILILNKKLKTKYDNNYCAGVTILPSKPKNKIQILISENSCTPDVILHELTHMYDFVLFSEYFCKGKIHKIRKHKFCQSLIYWSEFHVKQIDIPYLHLFIDMHNNIPQEKYLYDFRSKIKSIYFQGYTQKLLAKTEFSIRDIMWYLGEVYVCNIYDEQNTYTIPQEIIEEFDASIMELYNLLSSCPDFATFVEKVEKFHNYFQ